MGIFSRSTPDIESLRQDIERQTKRVREVLATIEALETDIKARFREVEERVEAQGKHVRLMAEEMEERIDRGNKIWRKIRASEYYDRQREEGEEDENAGDDLPLFDGTSGQREGLPPVHQGLGRIGRPPSPAQEMGKALARRIAGIG